MKIFTIALTATALIAASPVHARSSTPPSPGIYAGNRGFIPPPASHPAPPSPGNGMHTFQPTPHFTPPPAGHPYVGPGGWTNWNGSNPALGGGFVRNRYPGAPLGSTPWTGQGYGVLRYGKKN